MTATQRGLLTLLKSAVTGENLDLPEDFRLDDADAIIRRQSLLPLAYQGAYYCGISTKMEIMQRYQRQYYRILMHSEKQLRALQQVFSAFEAGGVDYLPLKGCNLKQLYPQPELRMMGDADILIRTEQYGLIKPIMEMLGFSGEKEDIHVIEWNREDIHLELHKYLISPGEKDLHAYFGTGWDLAVRQEGCRYDLRREDNYVFLFTHMAKHYRISGIGCRQFLDLFVYQRAYPNLDESYIECAMERLHLLEFYRNTRKLLGDWFEDGTGDEKTEFMSQYILSGGNWGDVETLLLSRQVRMHTGEETIRHVKAKRLRSMIFPSAEKMETCFPVLERYPRLRQFFWPVWWMKKIFQKPLSIKKKLQAVHNLSDKKVVDRKRMLNYMGLDFYDE